MLSFVLQSTVSRFGLGWRPLTGCLGSFWALPRGRGWWVGHIQRKEVLKEQQRVT